MKAFSGLLLVFLSLQLSRAQPDLTGTVVDAVSGQVLIGASVYLLRDFSQGVSTDRNGNFVFHLTGRFLTDSILISYIGYEERVLDIEAVQGRIGLTPASTEMMEMEVSAESLIAEEFKYVSLNKLDIYTNAVAKADPLLAVTAMPSVTTTDESATISLRGSSPVETGIYLNSVPVYQAVRYAQVNGIGSFSLFNTALIKEVTVFPGNPPLEFGNSSSGVVSIVTDDAPVLATANSITVSPASAGLQRDQQFGAINLKGFANYQPSQILQWMNPEALNQLRGFHSLDAGIYLYGQLKNKISFKSYHYELRERYRYHYLHPTYDGDFDQNKFQQLNVSTLSYEMSFAKLTWNQGYAFSRSRFAYSLSDFQIWTHSWYQSLVFSRLTSQWQFKTGVSYDANNSEVKGDFFVYEYAVGDSFPVYHSSFDATAVNIESFAYAKYCFTDRFIIGGGIRKNLNPAQSKNYLSAQINMTRLIGEHWKVIAGVGRYHKFALNQQSTATVFAVSDQASLDMRYETRQSQFCFSVFAKANEINGVQNDFVGFELSVHHEWANDLEADCSYSYLSPQKESAYDLQYFIKASVSYSPAYWTLGLNTIYRQGQWYSPVEKADYFPDLDVYVPSYAGRTAHLPDYFILNLSVSRLVPIHEELGMVFFASMNNMTNHQNIRSYNYDFEYQNKIKEYLGRRLGYAGIQVKF